MSPTASQASSKPPVYPKNVEPAHRAPSKTRSRDPVRKPAADSGLRKRSQSQEVPTGNRSQSRSTKSVSSTSNSSITAKPTVESRDQYIRAAQRDSQSLDVRYQNVRLKSAAHGKTAGPLKAFPFTDITNGNAPIDAESTDSVSIENLLVDLNGNYSVAEIPASKNGRRHSTSEKLSTSSLPRPLPVFIKPDVLPTSLQTLKSDRTVGNGSASKQSGRSQRDLITRSESEKIDNENRKTSAKAADKDNQDVTEMFERIGLDSTRRNAKPQTSIKTGLPDIEVKGNSFVKAEPSETARKKGSNPKFTEITEKSVHMGVNGGGEVLGGRSQTEGYDCSKDRMDHGVKSRSRRPSIGPIKDFTNHSVSSKPSKSDFRTETFVFNVDQSLETENDVVDRNHKTNIDSDTKPSSSPVSFGKKFSRPAFCVIIIRLL